ncbi:hypothetical protein D3C73_1365890 [compost metagenome]
MQLRACHYDGDSEVMTVVLADGTTCSLNCYEIEVNLDTHAAVRYPEEYNGDYLKQ